MIKYKGKSLRQHARDTGIHEDTLRKRWRAGLRGKELLSPVKIKKEVPRYPYKNQMMTIREIAELENCGYSTAYKKVQGTSPGIPSMAKKAFDPHDPATIEKELRGEIPISGGAFRGCTQEQIDAMLSGDVNALLKAG